MKAISTHIREHGLFLTGAAVCLGAAVPLSQIGISYTVVLLAIAAVFLLLDPQRSTWLTGAALQFLSPLGIAIAVVFVAWIPSLFFSIDPGKSVQVWARMIAYVCLGALLWSFLAGHRPGLRLCQKTLIIVSGLTVVLVAVNFLGGTEYVRWLRFKGLVEGYPPQVMKLYASPAACMVPVLLCLGWNLGRLWWWSCCVIVMGLVVFTHLTGSGAAQIGLVFGAYCFVVFWIGRRNRAITMVGMGLLAIAIAGWFVWFSGQDIPDYVNYNGYPVSADILDRHRQIIWLFVLERIPDVLWTGYGIDSINKIPGANETIVYLNAEYLPSHPHDWALEVLAETGVFGLLALLGAIGTAFWSLIRRGQDQTWVVLAAVALLGVYFGSGLFSFSFWATWWQLVLINLWVILMAMDGDHAGSSGDRPLG